jgi:hypothetical protein
MSRRSATRRAGNSSPVVLGAANRRRLSEGAVVQGSVRARLLGIPLLRLEATLALMPAAFTPSSAPLGSGESFAEAVRSINDGAEVLAEIRRNNGH